MSPKELVVWILFKGEQNKNIKERRKFRQRKNMTFRKLSRLFRLRELCFLSSSKSEIPLPRSLPHRKYFWLTLQSFFTFPNIWSSWRMTPFCPQSHAKISHTEREEGPLERKERNFWAVVKSPIQLQN